MSRKVLLIQTDSWFCSGAREHLKDSGAIRVEGGGMEDFGMIVSKFKLRVMDVGLGEGSDYRAPWEHLNWSTLLHDFLIVQVVDDYSVKV